MEAYNTHSLYDYQQVVCSPNNNNDQTISKSERTEDVESQTENSIKEIKKERVLKSLRKERSEISKQLILCIALMNEFCSIRMSLPFKVAKFTEQYMRIKSVGVDNEWFEIGSFLKKKCDEIYSHDTKNGVSEKTAARRKQRNKKIVEIHLYQDLLVLKGYCFGCFENYGGEGTKKLQSIKQVFRNGKLMLDEERIERKISNQRRKYPGKVFSKDKQVQLTQVDFVIETIGNNAKVKAIHTINNNSNDDCNVTVSITLDDESAVTGYSFKTQNREFVSQLKEKEKAKTEQSDATASGYSSALMEQIDDTTFSVSLGLVQKHSEVSFSIEYITHMDIDENELVLKIPNFAVKQYQLKE